MNTLGNFTRSTAFIYFSLQLKSILNAKQQHLLLVWGLCRASTSITAQAECTLCVSVYMVPFGAVLMQTHTVCFDPVSLQHIFFNRKGCG